MFTDCHARNEEGLWWSSWYSWSISGSCEIGMLSLLTLSPSLYLSLSFPLSPQFSPCATPRDLNKIFMHCSVSLRTRSVPTPLVLTTSTPSTPAKQLRSTTLMLRGGWCWVMASPTPGNTSIPTGYWTWPHSPVHK